jgi:tripartite-type tricarboxylate transporter receptor subunit TctC
MVPGRRAFLSMVQAAGLAAALPRVAHAQAAFPSKPVHLIVPYAPGGSADVLSRIVAQHLSQQWGQPVIVETRPGGGTIIGTSLVAKAPADGYTMLFISNSFVINAKLRADLPYDGVKAFVPVANMVSSPQVAHLAELGYPTYEAVAGLALRHPRAPHRGSSASSPKACAQRWPTRASASAWSPSDCNRLTWIRRISPRTSASNMKNTRE